MITHKDFPENILLLNIIEQMSNKYDQVRFALFCAKDCFHLNSKKTKSKSQTCIKLVELWLISNEEKRKSLEPKLTKAADSAAASYAAAAYSASSAYSAAYSAASAAYSAAYSAASAAYSAYSADAAADTYAADAAAYQSEIYNEKIFDQKLQEYTNLAKSLLSTTKFKHTEFSKTLIKHDQNIDSIMALLDHLSEENENLVLHTDIGYKLNLPSGYNVEARTYDELVRKIVDLPALIEYLKHLYT